jgi:deaminated glutathione amidase
MSQFSLNAAAIQLEADDDVERNLGRVAHWVQRAADRGAELVVLPENFAYFGTEAGKVQVAESLTETGPILGTLRELAARHAVHLIAAGMPERSSEPARPYNTSVVVGPSGEVVGSYRKLHLFDVELADGTAYRESAGTSAGEGAVVVEIGGAKVGLVICYDLRFSRLFEALANAGADVLALGAAFTDQTGRDHWHVLLRARAIEWQSWVIAAAQHGRHPGGRRTYGHALIADPWGVVVSECSNREGFALTSIDSELVSRVRAQLPCREHRRAV